MGRSTHWTAARPWLRSLRAHDAFRVGIQLTSFAPQGAAPADLLERHVELTLAAEDAGFDTSWAMDHLIGLDA